MLDPLCMVPGFIMKYMCTDTFILADIIVLLLNLNQRVGAQE